MSNYAKIKKLDEKSLQKLQEGAGPADECLCSLFSPEIEKRSLAASVKKALGLSGRKKERFSGRGTVVDIPLTFSKSGKDKEKLKDNIKVIVERASVPTQSMQNYSIKNEIKDFIPDK